MGETLGHSPEIAESNVEVVAPLNLPEYISNFEKEINFDDSVEKRLEEYQKEHPEDPLTQIDKNDLRNTMRADKNYKHALWDWRDSHRISISQFDFPEAVTASIYRYWQTIEDFRKEQRKGFDSKEDIINYDIKRSADHTNAAQKLVESGLAPNITIGRLLIQFMSIEKGYDREDRDRDEKRLNYFR